MRARLTYANVMATLAVVIALSAGAYAAIRLPKDSVRSRNIVNHGVKHRDLAAGAVGGTNVRPNSLGGSQINESTLDGSILQRRLTKSCAAGTALSAVDAKGNPSCVRAADGQTVYDAQAVAFNHSATTTLPGHWTVTFDCADTFHGGFQVVQLENLFSDPMNVFTMRTFGPVGSADINYTPIVSNTSTGSGGVGFPWMDMVFSYQLSDNNFFRWGTVRVDTAVRQNDCHYQLQALVSS
jgi:hypothetical protein